MKKKIIVFAMAVTVSLVAATHRWNDSAHAIGVIKAGGGTARHPVSLESGEESYMLIATATVIPPYRGDVKVVLEGEPAMEYEIHSSGPVLDLGLHTLAGVPGQYVLRPQTQGQAGALGQNEAVPGGSGLRHDSEGQSLDRFLGRQGVPVLLAGMP